MKTVGWWSFKTIWLVILLVASSCALVIVGWVAAEWRVQHTEEELRLNFLHQVGEIASIINPSHAAALSFEEGDTELPAFERIREQFKAYSLEVSVAAIYGLGIQNGEVVYGPSLFLRSQPAVEPGSAYPLSNADFEESLKTGKRLLLTSSDQKSITVVAPVVDSQSNEVLMAVALDIPEEHWQKKLEESRYLPFLLMLILLIFQFLSAGAIYLRTSWIPDRLRHLETVLVAILCVLLICAVAFIVYETENRERRIQFMRLAESETEIIESNLRSIRQEVTKIALYVQKSESLTRNAFSAFSESLLNDNAVESCYMITGLRANEKGKLEQRAKGEGFPEYQIYRLDDSENKVPVSDDMGTLYPIYYDAQPLPGAIGAGFDLGSVPEERVALENAARTGMPTASTPNREEIAAASGKRVSIYAPIYDSDSAGNKLLRGFVAARIRLDMVLRKALASVEEKSSYMSVELFQLLANEAPMPLADVIGKITAPQSPLQLLGDFGDNKLSLTHSMFILSNTYALMVQPTPGYFIVHPIRNTYATVLVALIIAMVITVFVGMLRNQQGTLEARVWGSTVELRESGETFRRLFAESTDPILLLQKGKIVDCNNATLRLLKYGSKQQVLKKSPISFSPEKQPDGRPSSYVFKEMEGLCVRNGHHSFEWTQVKSDGTLVPVETMFTLITIRGENHIHVIWRDITERKLAEEALRSSEEKHRTLVDSLPIGLFRYTPTPEEQFVMVNRAMVKIHGSASAEELMQVNAGDLYANSEDREALWRDLDEHGYVEGREVQLRRKDGSIIWGSLSGTIIRNSKGDIEYFDGSVMDITEKKQVDEQRMEMERRLLHSQKLESLGVLAGGIAHDFNNLLAIVLGNLEFAAGEVHRETAAYECVTKAVLAARRAAALTDQMLAYSGKGRFVIKAMDLSVEIEENLQILSSSISKDVTLDLSLQEPLPPIYADEGQIQQVVMNLISNASEAIGDNPGSIAIKTEVIECTAEDLMRSQIEDKPEPGDFIVLEIKDTGSGMDEETKNRIFDPFFTTKFTGRGLGMSAVLGIVQGHKGALELESEVGKGTTIRLLFPVAEPPEDLPVAEAYEAEPQQPAERMKLDTWSGTFLIVDDEAPLRELGEKVLSRFGFDTITANDGQEAVEIFSQRADDIVAVLLDLTMPRMDGVAAYEAMRQIKPNVKVILCSGFSEHEAMQRFSGHGLAGYVHKPYRITTLREEIEKVMKGKGNLA